MSPAVTAPLERRSHEEPAQAQRAGGAGAQSRAARARAGYTAVVKQSVAVLLRHDSSGARHALGNLWRVAEVMVDLLEGPVDAASEGSTDSGSDTGSDDDPAPNTVKLIFTMQALEGVPLARLQKIQGSMRAAGVELTPANLPGLPNYEVDRPERQLDVSPQYGWMVRHMDGTAPQQKRMLLDRWMRRTPGPADPRNDSDMGRWLLLQAVHRLVNIMVPREHMKSAAAEAIRRFEEIDRSDASAVDQLFAYNAVYKQLMDVTARLCAQWPDVDSDLEARFALASASDKAHQGADALVEKGNIHEPRETPDPVDTPAP
ncbi:MAG: hypothetical protein H7332_10290 [Bdellovibrionales bacterium]|nr:hypothetical protein [Ramlibacter sp.]